MAEILIDFGKDTEILIQYVLDGFEKAGEDEIEIKRSLEKSVGLAGEPITISAIIAFGTLAIPLMTKLLRQYLETQRQMATLRIVADGFEKDPEAGAALERIAHSHANVAISFQSSRTKVNNGTG
jgi:hypothetical protein